MSASHTSRIRADLAENFVFDRTPTKHAEKSSRSDRFSQSSVVGYDSPDLIGKDNEFLQAYQAIDYCSDFGGYAARVERYLERLSQGHRDYGVETGLRIGNERVKGKYSSGPDRFSVDRKVTKDIGEEVATVAHELGHKHNRDPENYLLEAAKVGGETLEDETQVFIEDITEYRAQLALFVLKEYSNSAAVRELAEKGYNSMLQTNYQLTELPDVGSGRRYGHPTHGKLDSRVVDFAVLARPYKRYFGQAGSRHVPDFDTIEALPVHGRSYGREFGRLSDYILEAGASIVRPFETFVRAGLYNYTPLEITGEPRLANGTLEFLREARDSFSGSTGEPTEADQRRAERASRLDAGLRRAYELALTNAITRHTGALTPTTPIDQRNQAYRDLEEDIHMLHDIFYD